MQDADIYQVCRETSSWELILSNFNDPAEQEKIKVGMEYCKKVEGYLNEYFSELLLGYFTQLFTFK